VLGAAETVRQAIDVPIPDIDRASYYDGVVTDVRFALGEERFTAAWAEGRAMPLEEAICATLADG
jgi:hypothetical protein